MLQVFNHKDILYDSWINEKYCSKNETLAIFVRVEPRAFWTILADIDISMNPNTLNLWTFKYEYIKKTGTRIHFLFKIEEIRESNYFQTKKSGNTIFLKSLSSLIY